MLQALGLWLSNCKERWSKCSFWIFINLKAGQHLTFAFLCRQLTLDRYGIGELALPMLPLEWFGTRWAVVVVRLVLGMMLTGSPRIGFLYDWAYPLAYLLFRVRKTKKALRVCDFIHCINSYYKCELPLVMILLCLHLPKASIYLDLFRN